MPEFVQFVFELQRDGFTQLKAWLYFFPSFCPNRISSATQCRLKVKPIHKKLDCILHWVRSCFEIQAITAYWFSVLVFHPAFDTLYRFFKYFYLLTFNGLDLLDFWPAHNPEKMCLYECVPWWFWIDFIFISNVQSVFFYISLRMAVLQCIFSWSLNNEIQANVRKDLKSVNWTVTLVDSSGLIVRKTIKFRMNSISSSNGFAPGILPLSNQIN